MKSKDEDKRLKVKTDLKHDTLEFNESIENENVANADEEIKRDDEEITAEELDMLEEDDQDSQAYALNSVETDSRKDENKNLSNENWTDDFPDKKQKVNKINKHHHRK